MNPVIVVASVPSPKSQLYSVITPSIASDALASKVTSSPCCISVGVAVSAALGSTVDSSTPVQPVRS